MNNVHNWGDEMNTSKITKDQILKSAAKLAREHGLSSINIRAVAKECQVSIGSIYNYFPDKSDLVVSVIESFWKQACTLDDMRKLNLSDFTSSYLQMYHILYEYFHRFEHEWILQLQTMDQKTKQLGRKIEESYYQDIKTMMEMMIAHDPHISEQHWNDSFTKDAFISFVFTNTLSLLKQNCQNPTFFISVLHKLLS